MSFDNVEQFLSEEDGCLYFYDEKRNSWKKICDVTVCELPVSVKNKVREEQQKAERLLKLPLR